MAKILNPSHLTLPESVALPTPPAGFTAVGPLTDGGWDFKLPGSLTDDLGDSIFKEIVVPTVISGGAVASVTLTPTTVYPVMRIDCAMLTTDAAVQRIRMTINGDTGANYDYCVTIGTYCQDVAGGADFDLHRYASDGTATPAYYGNLCIWIFNGDSSSQYKHLLWRGYSDPAIYCVCFGGGHYKSNTALSTVELYFSAGNVDNGSEFVMYGWDV